MLCPSCLSEKIGPILGNPEQDKLYCQNCKALFHVSQSPVKKMKLMPCPRCGSEDLNVTLSGPSRPICNQCGLIILSTMERGASGTGDMIGVQLFKANEEVDLLKARIVQLEDALTDMIMAYMEPTDYKTQPPAITKARKVMGLP
jgi:hypothetical protein